MRGKLFRSCQTLLLLFATTAFFVAVPVSLSAQDAGTTTPAMNGGAATGTQAAPAEGGGIAGSEAGLTSDSAAGLSLPFCTSPCSTYEITEDMQISLLGYVRDANATTYTYQICPNLAATDDTNVYSNSLDLFLRGMDCLHSLSRAVTVFVGDSTVPHTDFWVSDRFLGIRFASLESCVTFRIVVGSEFLEPGSIASLGCVTGSFASLGNSEDAVSRLCILGPMCRDISFFRFRNVPPAGAKEEDTGLGN